MSPFVQWVGWGISTHTADLILEGTSQPLEVNDLTNDLIHHMKKCTTLDKVLGILRHNAWVNIMKDWSEQTTTSPQLTHSKALLFIAPWDMDS